MNPHDEHGHARESLDELVPLPHTARSVLIFGGTFDPPTIAHLELPQRVREALGIEWLLYIPAGQSPHKNEPPGASANHRMGMLGAMLSGVSNCAVSAIEIARDDIGPSYTIDTLRALRMQLPDSLTLRLLIGADQASAFHRWREPREIMTIAEPAVMLRTPTQTWEALRITMEPHWSASELEQWGSRVVNVPTMDASATDVRSILRSFGPDDPRLTSLLPTSVLRYIRDHGLYR